MKAKDVQKYQAKIKNRKGAIIMKLRKMTAMVLTAAMTLTSASFAFAADDVSSEASEDVATSSSAITAEETETTTEAIEAAAESTAEKTANEDEDFSVELMGVYDYDTTYAVEGGNIYFNSSTGAIVKADTTITSAVIPSEINGVTVTTINGAGAFFNCTNLTSITIPEISTVKLIKKDDYS